MSDDDYRWKPAGAAMIRAITIDDLGPLSHTPMVVRCSLVDQTASLLRLRRDDENGTITIAIDVVVRDS